MTSSMPENSIDGSAPPLIAHVIYRLDVGGMENGLVNLINGLPRNRYRHAIICLTRSSEFQNRLRGDNVDIYELRKREGKDFLTYVRFWRLLRKLRPTILHTRNLGTLDLALIAMLAGVPVRVHGEHGWDAGDAFGQSYKYRLLRKLCNVAVTKYVAVSQDIKNWLQNVTGVRSDNVQQIYNGVDVDKFQPKGPIVKLPFKGPDKASLVVGAVGRMDRIKNFDLLITAVARLVEGSCERRDRLRLVIVGHGSQLRDLQGLVEELKLEDIVWMPGERHDIAELLRSMDVFVLPSRNEGISNTILEAMSTGLPVIATEVGGSPELVSDGETGQLIPANDPGAISDAIERFLVEPDLINVQGKAARDHIVKRFSLPAMVASYAQLYDGLLDTNSLARIN